MALKRKCYGSDDLEEALKRIDAGEKIALVSRELGIPLRTLFRKHKIRKTGIIEKKPGPKPKLGIQMETDLVDWIKGMQQQGFPVDRAAILQKGVLLTT